MASSLFSDVGSLSSLPTLDVVEIHLFVTMVTLNGVECQCIAAWLMVGRRQATGA